MASQYNKWMFDKSKLNFPFPLFTTSMHMLVQFTLASLVLFLFPSLRPHNGYKSDLGQSRHETERPLMTKMFYLTRIGPCGIATGLDIGLGNTSLQFITLTFYSELFNNYLFHRTTLTDNSHVQVILPCIRAPVRLCLPS